MAEASWGPWITALGSAGLLSFVVEVVRTLTQGRREKAALQLQQANAPQVAQSLLLGNTDAAIGIQQKVIERLHKHVAFQDQQMEDLRAQCTDRDEQIGRLRERLSDRDARLAALEIRAARLAEQVTILAAQIAGLTGKDPRIDPELA
jgi:uncharacterized coiled-coil protein SlyX